MPGNFNNLMERKVKLPVIFGLKCIVIFNDIYHFLMNSKCLWRQADVWVNAPLSLQERPQL